MVRQIILAGFVVILPVVAQAQGRGGMAAGSHSFAAAPRVAVQAPRTGSAQAMPGTRMAFVGIKNEKDIADRWAYLKQFGPDGEKKCA